MKSGIKLAICLASILVSGTAFSGETGWVSVLAVGGQDGHIFVQLSATATADQGCSNPQLRFPPGSFVDADTQKRFYAALLTAMLTGKKMNIYLSYCNGLFPYMAPYDYWFMQNQ
jgi:hypothetical protein